MRAWPGSRRDSCVCLLWLACVQCVCAHASRRDVIRDLFGDSSRTYEIFNVYAANTNSSMCSINISVSLKKLLAKMKIHSEGGDSETNRVELTSPGHICEFSKVLKNSVALNESK